MRKAKVDFATLSWEETTVGARFKAAISDGKKLRLVEFTSEFVEHDWCVKGHVGYVLEGAMDIAFEDRTERFVAGDGLLITEGERHRASVIGSVVRLMLVEDI